jgi:P4 family phage/plasmid primase-like protien
VNKAATKGDSVAVRKGDHRELARAIAARLADDEANLVFAEGQWWHWNSRYWEPMLDEVLDRAIASCPDWAEWEDPKGLSRITMTSGLLSGTSKLLEAMRSRSDFFQEPPVGTPMANGVVVDGILQPHNRNLRHRHMIPHKWDPDAKCPMFAAFLGDLFGDRIQTHGKLLVTWLGAALSGTATDSAIAIMLAGGGGDGKTTLCNILLHMFDARAVSSVPPHKLSSDYEVATLAGKALNIVSDMPETSMAKGAGGPFKQCLSGDLVSGRFPHGRPFTFRPRAAHLYSTNILPEVSDQTDGFWRRWALLTTEGIPPENRKHPDSVIRPIVENELPGIIRWALGAYMQSRKSVIIPPAVQESTSLTWRQRGVKGTLTDCIESAFKTVEGTPSEVGAPGVVVHEMYRAWCVEARRAYVNPADFSLMLQQMGIGVGFGHGSRRFINLIPTYREATRLGVEKLIRDRWPGKHGDDLIKQTSERMTQHRIRPIDSSADAGSFEPEQESLLEGGF